MTVIKNYLIIIIITIDTSKSICNTLLVTLKRKHFSLSQTLQWLHLVVPNLVYLIWNTVSNLIQSLGYGYERFVLLLRN